MIYYILIDPVTGRQWVVPEAELTRNLQLNCVLLRDGEHIGVITHRDLVLFARWCAGMTLTRMEGPPDKRVTHALALVDQWLEDEKSVTSEELGEASDAARAARAAAWAAAWAARDAAAAGAAAAWAARATWAVSYEAQAQWLVDHLRSAQ